MEQFASPIVSAIIPSKYRPADLGRTVESLLKQTMLPKQIIIVDQSEQQENRNEIEKLYSTLPPETRDAVELSYIHDCTIEGPIVARNRGMMVASGEILAFFDDDVCLERTYLEELVAAYNRDAEVVGVSGMIANYHLPPWHRRLWSTLFVRGNFHDERQVIYWHADQLRDSHPIRVRKFTGACMSFRAEATHGHWFDENLPNTFEEDWDFCISLGPDAKLVIAPRARLLHLRSAPGRSKKHHLRNEARSTYYLHRKHWNYGLKNRICFWWINVGYALLATVGSLRRLTLAPWRALISGAAEGNAVASKPTPPSELIKSNATLEE